jgi:hypothetical protein
VLTALGLSKEPEVEVEGARTQRSSCRKPRSDPIDYASGAVPTTDDVPGEDRVFYDLDNPVMEPGSLYKTMDTFRLAVRQYAMNNKFDLGVESSNRYRFRGFCRGGDDDCPFSIHARQEMKGSPIIQVLFVFFFCCRVCLLCK